MKKIYNIFDTDSIVCLSFVWAFLFYMLNMPNVYNDHDIFWHIQAGEEIIYSKSLVLNNGWSFSSPDHYWYNISWLWDIILWAVDKFLSIKYIYLLTAILYGLIISLISKYLILFKKLDRFEIIFSVFLSTLILWDFASSRPYTLTIIFSLIYLIQLKKYSVKKNLSLLVPLPLIMLIWVNTHGGFFIGCYLLLCYFVFNTNSFRDLDYKFLLIAISTALILFVNPYHIHIIKAVASTTSSEFTKSIDEWQPLSFGKHHFIFCIYFLFFILTMDIRNNYIGLFEKFNSFLWLIMSLLYVRNIPIFVILSITFFTSNIQNLRILKQLKIEPSPLTKKQFLLCLICLLSIAIVFTTKYWPNVLIPKENPIPAIKYITHKHPEKKFLNDYGIGGAIIYFGKGNQKVFVDGRAGTAYPEKVLEDYKSLAYDLCSTNQILDKYKVDGIISNKNSVLNKIISKKSNWFLVYDNNNYSVYIRHIPPVALP